MSHDCVNQVPKLRHLIRLLLTGILPLVFLSSLLAEDGSEHQTDTFPDTASLLAAVIQRETEADLELRSLVFKDDVTVSAIDAAGQLRATHTETRYVNAPGYDPFALHITTNGKSLAIPLSEILAKSRVFPQKWSKLDGTDVVVFSFEPQSLNFKHGDLESRIAGNLRGTVWVSPSDASIVRFEFRTVVPIVLGKGFLGRLDCLEGMLQMREADGDLWLPAHQEFVTQGKNTVGIVVGVRISKRFRTQEIDDLSRYAPAFDMVQARPATPSYGASAIWPTAYTWKDGATAFGQDRVVFRVLAAKEDRR